MRDPGFGIGIWDWDLGFGTKTMLKKILNILGWIGTGLVFAAVAVKFAKPELDRVWYWLAVSGLALVLVYTLSQWREVVRMFSGRQARYGSLTAVSVLVVIGILGAINYLSDRHNKRWDLTAAKQFSLSDQSRRVLQSLKAPVKFLVFDRENEFERFRDRLREYEYTSKQVSVEYNDVDKKPAIARQYQVQSYGTVVVEYQGRTERVTSDNEQELTNALIKAVEGKQKKVYFVQGHGERDTGSAERTGYNTIAAALANENFLVEKTVLAQQKEAPADANVLVIAGPRTDLLQPEADMVRAYLKKGGKVLFMLDPPGAADAAPLANITALLKDWAIEVGNSVVVDVSGIGQLIGTDASVPVAANYPSHPITERLGNVLTAYPLARAISPVSGGVEGRTAQTFIETSPRSWAETDIKGLMQTGKVAMEADKGDKQGPISIGVAVSTAAPEAPPTPANGDKEAPKPETRVAAIGDSDFPSNAALGISGNRDMFLNVVNWLAQQENLISIRPRDPEDRRITLTADQQRRIFWLSVLLVPGAVLATGMYTWWRRR